MKQVFIDIRNFWLKVRGFLSRRDLVPKLISLLLAAILWAYIGSTRLTHLDYRIPIEIINQPANLVITNQNLKSVTLQLNGKKDDFNSFALKNVKAVINLEGAREGSDLRFPIDIVKQEVPEGIRLSLSRKYVSLDLEKKSSKRVPVEPVLTEMMRDGIVIGPPSVKPEFVIISGEASRLRLIESVTTETVSIGSETGRIEKDVPVNMKELKGLDIYPVTVRVYVPVYEMENTQTFEIPLLLKNVREDIIYDAARKKVKVMVKKLVKDIQINKDDFDAYLDCSRVDYTLFDTAEEISSSMRVNAVLKAGREGAAVIMVTPGTVQVKMKRE